MSASTGNPIRYATGALELAATDLYSSGFGAPWGHARTYGHRLFQNGGLDSYDGVNGRNWFVATAPYLVETAEGSDGGAIAVMGNINATLWFDFLGSAPVEYVNRFGGPETLEHDATAQIFRLRSEDGTVTEFHDFDQTANSQGLFKRSISPGGQITEVVSYSGGEIREIQRTANVDGTTVTESFVYTRAWYGRLTEVLLRRREGSDPWNNQQRVVFTYWSNEGGSYWEETNRGSSGDLRSAETFEHDGSGWKHTGTTYYAYYTQGEAGGFVFGLKHVLGPAAVARMVVDGQASSGDFPYTISVPSTTDLAAYADNTFEYDAERRVSKETVQGGTLTYQYAYATSSHPEGTANWKTKTTETLPDGTQRLIYSNADGQTLLSVHQTAAGDWLEFAEYDENGHRTLHAHSSAVVSYDDTQADLGVMLKTNSGLIELSEYYGPADPAPAKLKAQRVQQGAVGAPVTLREYEYASHTANGSTVHRVSKETVYRNEDGTGAIETTYAYAWHAGTNRLQQRTTTLPAVPASQNGSGVAATRTERFDVYGNLTWSKDERGVITKQEVVPTLGVATRRIEDVDTTQTSDEPSGWSTPAGFGLHLVSDFEYDEQGRITRVLGPEHTADVEGVATLVRRAQWTAYLEDGPGREIRSGRGYFKLADSSETLINPVAIRKQTHQGHVLEEIQAVQGLPGGSSGSSSGGTLEEAQLSVAGPVSDDEYAFPQESYVRWSTQQYANCCQLVSSRVYHAIPEFGEGAEGTNYDQTGFDHDTMGRRNRVQSPGGTITFTVFDARGQAAETWIGTNDDGATEADPSGGGLDPDNDMVLVSENQYDNGTAGEDGNLTKQTQHVNASTTRVTVFAYDWRNRQTETDGEEDFFEKRYYDNLGRVVQTERYDTTASGNLVARNETLFDDRGRVYKTIQHEVDLDTGIVGSSLVDDIWYDETHNVVKRQPEGVMTWIKFNYDSLNRLLTETDPRGAVTVFSYDDAGNRLSLTDAESNTTTWGYDAIGRMVAEMNELNDSRLFEYDPAGNLFRRTDRNGRVIEFAYDDIGRVKWETWFDGATTVNTITTAYGAESRVTSISDNNVTYAYGYDGRGRIIEIDNNGTPGVPRVILTANYDRLDERTSLATSVNGTADFANVYAHDGLGRMSRVEQTGSGIASKRADFSHTPLGGFDSIDRYADTMGSSLVASTSYSHDGYNRLTGTTHAQGTTTLSSYDRTFDADRRVSSATVPDGTSDYGYDTAGQITSADHTFQTDESYSYDDTGNRTNTGYVTGSNNRLLNDGTHSYEYDPEGNRTKRTTTTTGEFVEYSWDHRDRLVGVTFKDSAGSTLKAITYTYDPGDRRIARWFDSDGDGFVDNEQRFVFDQGVKNGLDDCLLVFDGTGNMMERYLHGPAIDQPLAVEDGSGDVLWMLADPLGTVHDLAKRNAGTGTTSIVNHLTYDSFGEITTQSNPSQPSQYGFTGRKWDGEAGLWWYRARWYDPGVGRFVSEDPIGFEGGDMSLYRYVENSPIGDNDPSGRTCGSAGNDWLVPDTYISFNFTAACQWHDDCYGTCGNTKEFCDIGFYNRMMNSCRNVSWIYRFSCRSNARTYYYAVKWAAGGAYEDAQKEVCGCNDPPPGGWPQIPKDWPGYPFPAY